MKTGKKGFTLMEMLIVVAIIAILVAIGIPVLSAQLEKARQAVDLAQIRSAYALVQTAIMTETGPDGKELPDGEPIYYFTNSGTFQRWTLGSAVGSSNAYRLKSNGVELPEYLQVNTQWGWKDCGIMVTFYSNTDAAIYTCYIG